MKKEKVENLLRENIKDEIVLISALKINSALYSKDSKIYHTSFNRLASAIAYIAFIKINQVKSLDEISDMFEEVTRTDVGRTYKKIKRVLGMNFCKKEKMSMMGTSCIIQRMPKDFLEKIKMSEKSKKYAIQILKKLEKNQNFQGKNPVGVCAATVYISLLMNNERKPQIQVAYLFGITQVSLRVIYQQIIEELGLADKLKINELKNDRTKS